MPHPNHPTQQHNHRLTLVAAAALIVTAARPAAAHEGPPYPILVDKPVAGYLVSVWADPDLGTGTFYVMTDPADGSSNAETLTEPAVAVWVQPVTERLPKVTYTAEREALRNRVQFVAHPEFDALEQWTIGVQVTPPGEPTTELVAEVEVTPPGLGAWDLLIYLFPFALIGGLWAIALFRRWNDRRPQSAPSSTASSSVSEST